MASATVCQSRVPANRAVVCAALAHGVFTLVALHVAVGAGIVTRAVIAGLLGLAMCWASNTISHIHLHTPIFRAPLANRLFSLYLCFALTVPQRWWKRRHLAHHGLGQTGRRGPSPWSDAASTAEIAAVLVMLSVAAAAKPALFATVILPALIVGYGLCAVQGRAEHARADAGVDHHGRLYNALWFNDGYHAAHHRSPSAHWSEIANFASSDDVTSRWPPVLRLVEELPGLWNRAAGRLLDALEHLAMKSRRTRDFQVRRHARALASLLSPSLRARIMDVSVIGGALFPRSVLALAPLLPAARFHVVDSQAAHIDAARAILEQEGLLGRVDFTEGVFDPDHTRPCDLLVVPLALRGSRSRLYAAPPAPLVAVHDWIWHRRGQATALVSVLLAKRINLVEAESSQAPAK